VSSAFPVCPSEDVDAAWHLHLTYTRSYWKRFCGEVLGRPLHHDPTKGGPAEAKKHLDMYASTLAAYRQTFGEPPPPEVWTAPEIRFGDDLKHRVVNTARNWVIPKFPVRRAAWCVAAFAAVALFVPGCEGGDLNPFNLKGIEFLYFLIPVMFGAVCVGRVIRGNLRAPDPQPGDDQLQLTWEQTAYLAGGYPRLTSAAIARLVESGAAKLSDDQKRLQAARAMPERTTPVEKCVWDSLPLSNNPAILRSLQAMVAAVFTERAAKLEEDGLALPAARKAGIFLAAASPILVVIVFLAMPRLVLGLEDNKPVGYLVATMIIGGLIGLIASVVGSLRLTRRGENLLVCLKARNAPLKSGAAKDAAMAVALFGTVALAGTAVASLQSWYPRQTTDTTSGGCGSGCGTAGDGGGGGGGDGGGGGGGCGGGGGGGGD